MIENPNKEIQTIIEEFTNALSIENKSQIDMVFSVQGYLFKHFGRKSYPMLNNLLISMDKLHENMDFYFQKALEKAIGQAITAMGPEKLLSILPLNIGQEYVNTNSSI